MTQKSPEQLAKEIADVGISTDYPEYYEQLEKRIAAAIAEERAKVVVWPSKLACKDAYEACENLGDYSNVADGWHECFKWLKSQVKPITVPEFTDLEIEYAARDYCVNDFTIKEDGYTRDKRHFSAGFRSAMKLIKGEGGE